MVKRVVHKNIVLLIVAVAQFMVVLDSAIVNVALPSIFRDLHYASAADLQWIVTAYTLAFGGCLLLGGRAADLYGRKRVFLAAVGLFSVMSLACGLSQSPIMLDATRALQGLAAAFLSPAALSIVLTTFRGAKERAAALSVWGAVASGGAAAGVLFGGILTQYFDWRWNFFVNVPVGIAVFLAAWHYVPESKADLDHNKLDMPGAITVTLGLMALVYGITQAPVKGWTDGETLAFIGGAVVLLVAFLINEARSRHALMPLGIFKVGNVAAANAAQLPMIAAMFSMFFFVSLYVQQVLGFSPIKTGLSFLPVPFVIGLVATSMAKIVGKVGYKVPMVVGPFFAATGLFMLSRITVGGDYLTDVLPGLLVMGIGMGQIFIAVTIAATAGVPRHESGLASGLLNTSQQIGGALGLAILSGIATAGTKSYLSARGTEPVVNLAAAQVQGYHNALLVASIFPLLTALVALVFVRHYEIDESAEVIPA